MVGVNRKYKIAVMGATGVGKTIFFGSYFNLVTNLGRGSRPIMVKSQSSVNRIAELIKQLFEKHEVVQGTSERVDFSFSVDSLGMDVELFDIPGGFTQDMEAWVENKILPDLQRADGALFFISGEDLVKYPERVLKDNLVFAKAISKLREHKSGDLKGRLDVPIWFIFTKGDTIPDVSLDTLKEKNSALFKTASKSQDHGNWLEKTAYKKGKYVNAYKSQAIGKWESPQSVPRNYQPDMVIEPMEDLFEAMVHSRSAHGRTLRKIIAALVLSIFAVLEGGMYYYDISQWKGMQERVGRLQTEGRYEQALQEVEAFSSPSWLPAFFRAEKKLPTLREELYQAYEATVYAPIKAVLEAIDEEKAPDASPAFLEDAEKVKRYLSVTHFAEIQPQHYKLAKRREWYFDLGCLLNLDSQVQNASPDEMFNAVLDCLNYDVPESWQKNIQERIDNSLRRWGSILSLDVGPEAFDVYINKAEQLTGHPKLSPDSKDYLNAQKKSWAEKKLDTLIQAASTQSPEDGVALLERHKAEFGSIDQSKLEDTLEKHYAALVEQALKKDADDADLLQELLDRYPAMTSGVRDKLEGRIASIRGKQRQEWLRDLNASKNMEEMVDRITSFGGKDKDDRRQQGIDLLQKRIEMELENIGSEASKAVQLKDFSEGKQEAQKALNALRQTILPLNAGSLSNWLEGKEKAIMGELEEKHLADCREDFTRRRNTRDRRDVAECRKRLDAFLELWPNSAERKNVEEVRDFLNVIQGGVKGKLNVVKGTFSDAKDMPFDFWGMKTPDIFVTVSMGNKEIFRTKTVEGDGKTSECKFNEGIEFMWAVETPELTFKVFDEDLLMDDELITWKTTPSGFMGYKELQQRTLEGAYYLTIDFKPNVSIPECPW